MSAAEQIRELAFGMTYQAQDGKIVLIRTASPACFARFNNTRELLS